MAALQIEATNVELYSPAGQKLLAFSLEERMKDCEEARRVLRVVIVFPLSIVSCGLSGNPEVC